MIDLEEEKIAEIAARYSNVHINNPLIKDDSIPFDVFCEIERNKIDSIIGGKKKIYIDTKYWVYFREAAESPFEEKYGLYRQLYELLEKKVLEGKIVCPISTTNLTELLRQQNPEKKHFMAEMMDKLSCGYALRMYFDGIVDEFYNFLIDQCCEDSGSVKKCSRYDYIANVLGAPVGACDGVDEKTTLELQKEIYSLFEHITFADFSSFSSNEQSDIDMENLSNSKITYEMNKFKNENKSKTFEEVFNLAVSTIVVQFKYYIAEAFRKLYSVKYNREMRQAPAKVLDETILNRISSSIVYGFKNKKFGKDDLPMLYIGAVINAIIVKDGDRKFKDHDYADFRHAAEALTSCDYFFTERSLTELLTKRKPCLADMYGVRVVATPEDAIRLVEAL